MHVADTESREPSSWATIHDRLLLQDLARRQELDALIAADDAAHAERSKAWRANVERAKRQKLRRAAQVLERSPTAPTTE